MFYLTVNHAAKGRCPPPCCTAVLQEPGASPPGQAASALCCSAVPEHGGRAREEGCPHTLLQLLRHIMVLLQSYVLLLGSDKSVLISFHSSRIEV